MIPFAASGVAERFLLLADEDPTALVNNNLAHRGVLDPATLDEARRLARRLSDLLTHHPGAAALDRFLSEVESFDERVDRYALLHVLDFVAGGEAKETPWPGWRHPDPAIEGRPHRPLELGAFWLASHSSVDRTCTVALSVMGSSSLELALLQPEHVVMNGPQIVVNFPGGAVSGSLRSPAAPRSALVPALAVAAFHKRLTVASLSPQRPFLSNRNVGDTSKIQSNVLMNLRKPRMACGLLDDRSVKPLSVRNGAGRALFDRTRRIEDVAEMFGIDTSPKRSAPSDYGRA